MRQLTIRGFDAALAERVRQLARSERLSLNRAAVRLLRKGAGLSTRGDRPDVIGDSLDHLAGTWSARDERELLTAVETMAAIDPSLWQPVKRRARGRG